MTNTKFACPNCLSLTELCAIFGDFQQGAEIFVKYGYDFPKVGPGDSMYMMSIGYGTTIKACLRKDSQLDTEWRLPHLAF